MSPNIFKPLAGLIMMLALLGSSCSKSDDSTPEQARPILGRWLNVSGADDLNKNGTIEAAERYTHDSAASYILSFNADSTGSSQDQDGGFTLPFFWERINNNADLHIIGNSQFGTFVPFLHIESLSDQRLTLLDTSRGYRSYTDFRKL